MSKNCPFCPVDSKEEGWGMSPEGIEELRKRHIREHCFSCPTCGQPIQKRINEQDREVSKNSCQRSNCWSHGVGEYTADCDHLCVKCWPCKQWANWSKRGKGYCDEHFPLDEQEK